MEIESLKEVNSISSGVQKRKREEETISHDSPPLKKKKTVGFELLNLCEKVLQEAKEFLTIFEIVKRIMISLEDSSINEQEFFSKVSTALENDISINEDSRFCSVIEGRIGLSSYQDTDSESETSESEDEFESAQESEGEEEDKLSKERVLELDNIINDLLSTSEKDRGMTNIGEEVISNLIQNCRNIFLSESSLIVIESPVVVVGDIHGQFYDLLEIFKILGLPSKESDGLLKNRINGKCKYLFLGDYVDRGLRGMEVMTLLITLKIRYPKNIFLLRGNHESEWVNKQYGFKDECKDRYSVQLWKSFVKDCFNCLPIAAVISGKIFAIHGGLSPELKYINEINRIERPTDVPVEGLLCDLLWSDPFNGMGWARSEREISQVFGCDISEEFLRNNDLDLIVRAHEVVENGYRFFGPSGKDAKVHGVTVFSATCYNNSHPNNAAVLVVNEDLVCSFVVLKARKV